MTDIPFRPLPPPTVTVSAITSVPSFDARFHNSESINCGEPIIFHYTSAAGALGILGTGQLWSTLVYHMNDSMECRYAHDEAVVAAHQLLRDRTKEQQTVFIAELKSQLERISKIYLFATCFSEASDLLSQWRGYSNGSGYSLGFSLNELSKIADQQGLLVEEVIYDHQKQRERLTAPLVELLKAYDAGLWGEAEREKIDRAFWPAMQKIARESMRIKSPAFSEEREWRIFNKPFGEASTKMDFIIRNDEIVPILKIDLANGQRTEHGRTFRDICFRTCRTGPGANHKQRMSAIQALIMRQEVFWRLNSHSNASLR